MTVASEETALEYMLRVTVAEQAADQALLLLYAASAAAPRPLATYPDTLQPEQLRALPDRAVDELTVVDHCGGFGCAVLAPLTNHDDAVVLALFFAQPVPIDDSRRRRLESPLRLLSLVLNESRIREREAQNRTLSQLIHLTAQSWGDYPSPDLLLDLLHQTLLPRRYSTSAILLYGPLNEDPHQQRFDYLEVMASWSRRYGKGAGLGTKIYLHQDMPYLAALDAGETVSLSDTLPEFSAQLDPFVRALLRAEKLHALALIPLRAGQRRLGLLLVGTSRQRVLSAEEIQLCQTIGEFITLSTAAQILEQQRDLIRWGRVALLDAVTNGVVMVLPDAEGARVLTVNKVFAGLFEVAQADVQGLLLSEMLAKLRLSPAVRQDLAQQWLRVPVHDTARQHGEFTMQRLDASQRIVAWYSGPVYQAQRVIGRIYTFQDVTAERSAATMRATFLNRVSHELRTPLTSIQGFAQLILELADDELNPVAQDSAKTIMESSRQLRAVFDDLITLSRADADQMPLNLTPVSLPEVVAGVVADNYARSTADAQRIDVVSADNLPLVKADLSHLIEVLIQLLDNASRFSPSHSRIRVEISLVSQPSELKRSYAPSELRLPCVLTRVIDEGPGIAVEDLEHVFVPFFRSDWVQRQQLGGTGLGLILARRRIELHQGALWAEPASPDSPGGKLAFSLPLERG